MDSIFTFMIKYINSYIYPAEEEVVCFLSCFRMRRRRIAHAQMMTKTEMRMTPLATPMIIHQRGSPWPKACELLLSRLLSSDASPDEPLLTSRFMQKTTELLL